MFKFVEQVLLNNMLNKPCNISISQYNMVTADFKETKANGVVIAINYSEDKLLLFVNNEDSSAVCSILIGKDDD